MKQVFDLHLHTLYSDGEHSVKELIEIVRESGIKFFSITDHDSIDSIKKIKEYDLQGLEYIKGVEVSSILDGRYKLHILGYGVDENNEHLIEMLNELKERRKKRFKELVEYVEENYNLKIDKNDVELVLDKVNIPGKPHLAKLMMKYKYVSSTEEAFNKYLENAKTKTSNRMSADIVIDTLKKAGGKVIWAHPKKVEKQYNIDFKELMPRLLGLGIDGIEVYNSLHSYDDCKRYMAYADQKKLLKSGGSDYHGENVKPEVKIGVIYNGDDEISIDPSEINIREVKQMDKEVNNIKLTNINDQKLEGAKDFIEIQLNENVLPYIYENKLISAEYSPIYEEYVDIKVGVDKMFDIYYENSKPKEQKEREINELLIKLYNRTKKLIIEVSEEQKKSRQVDDSERIIRRG